MRLTKISMILILAAALGLPANAQKAAQKADGEVAMFGGSPSRNMVSNETGLPTAWDVKTGDNVKWTASLGSQSYGGPVVAGGRVFVGTNNEGLRNPKLTGDRGNVMAFDVETGELLWQAAHPKLPAGRVNDWPLQGVCSSPAVEGDIVYYVSNRAEVIAGDPERVARYRERVYARLQRTRVFQAVKASKVYNAYRLFRP